MRKHRTEWGWLVSRRRRRCAERESSVLGAGLWTSVEFFGRSCCRGRKTRLQLRSSLTTSAKKVFGKQRLTRLVNVSFPAPDSQPVHQAGRCNKRKLGFLFLYRHWRVSKAVMQRIANPSRAVRLRHAPPLLSPCLLSHVRHIRPPSLRQCTFGPGGEIGRHSGLKICFVKSFLLELPSQKVNSDNSLRASEL